MDENDSLQLEAELAQAHWEAQQRRYKEFLARLPKETIPRAVEVRRPILLGFPYWVRVYRDPSGRLWGQVWMSRPAGTGFAGRRTFHRIMIGLADIIQK